MLLVVGLLVSKVREQAVDNRDDLNAFVFPGAPETAYDGVDQDCDGADRVTDASDDTGNTGGASGGDDEGSKDTGGCGVVAAAGGGMSTSLIAGLLLLGARRRRSTA